ncbi:MAG: hypothetical protein IJE08_11580 [Clostridia bacterium]|nr:hypothetical protein [Clostridia bacterium]
MNQSRRIAFCSMMAALSTVLLIVGSLLGLGTYAAPMLAGLCLLPVGQRYGSKYQTLVWLAVSALSFILINNVEQNLMYLALFGCYPIIRPCFGGFNRWAKLVLKLAAFNVVILALEALVVMVLVPEVIGPGMAAALLLMGNVTFILYDYMIPRYELVMEKYLSRLTGRRK